MPFRMFDLHHQAAVIAAAKGDARAAEWALEHLRVVTPIDNGETGPRVTIIVGRRFPRAS